MINYIDGDLIKLAKEGKFDVIVHGCNCFCTMGSGIAPQMAKAFFVDRMLLEQPQYKGDYNKLGYIDWHSITDTGSGLRISNPNDLHVDNALVTVVNAYTQFGYGNFNPTEVLIPLDYEALALCMRKINYFFKGKHIGMPRIGSDRAGGDWNRIERIIEAELRGYKATVVNYKP